jgi:hypothetical protein
MKRRTRARMRILRTSNQGFWNWPGMKRSLVEILQPSIIDLRVLKESSGRQSPSERSCGH